LPVAANTSNLLNTKNVHFNPDCHIDGVHNQ
jgi:hypothetical protein